MDLREQSSKLHMQMSMVNLIKFYKKYSGYRASQLVIQLYFFYLINDRNLQILKMKMLN
jgi:hypothetical protein